MVGIDVEEFLEVRWREVLTEHKEKGMEEKTFHSENVSMLFHFLHPGFHVDTNLVQ